MPPRKDISPIEIDDADIPRQGMSVTAAHVSLLRVHEAAERLACSISTIRRLVAEKKLQAYRVGRGIRIAEADLERALKPVR